MIDLTKFNWGPTSEWFKRESIEEILGTPSVFEITKDENRL